MATTDTIPGGVYLGVVLLGPGLHRYRVGNHKVHKVDGLGTMIGDQGTGVPPPSPPPVSETESPFSATELSLEKDMDEENQAYKLKVGVAFVLLEIPSGEGRPLVTGGKSI